MSLSEAKEKEIQLGHDGKVYKTVGHGTGRRRLISAEEDKEATVYYSFGYCLCGLCGGLRLRDNLLPEEQAGRPRPVRGGRGVPVEVRGGQEGGERDLSISKKNKNRKTISKI